jgi:hypothetical protein
MTVTDHRAVIDDPIAADRRWEARLPVETRLLVAGGLLVKTRLPVETGLPVEGKDIAACDDRAGQADQDVRRSQGGRGG